MRGDSHDKFIHPVRLNYGLLPYTKKDSSNLKSQSNNSTSKINRILGINNLSFQAKNLDYLGPGNQIGNKLASRLDSDFTKNSNRLMNQKNTLSLNKINPLKQPKSAGRWPNNAININLSSYKTNNNNISPFYKKA